MISIHKTLFNSLDKILNKADRLKYDQHFVREYSKRCVNSKKRVRM